ncbi:hypothetical protein PpBr36_06811 [Pyricularia pennisetigena]|uniref:hypothetical protein n=1 Tax=Pyricularia pennisetigena TaxID=1578925 RepID=UPI00114FD76F|nr:hypothetical protein PpBr36_06811 [Pyricularia pennisetigena]TLS25375.1 hypothetical protein PpBr36_06811 [Pyricularia pennisetigena]
MSNETARKCDSLAYEAEQIRKFVRLFSKECYSTTPPRSAHPTFAMAYKLHIPDCILEPNHPFHFPSHNKPLRIRIQGPLISIQRLIPKAQWHQDFLTRPTPQVPAPDFARLTYRTIYGCDPQPEVPDDLVIRHEYCGWISKPPLPIEGFDYYGVTFDHLVPADDTNPEVLHINIIELEAKEGLYANGLNYANENLSFKVDPLSYLGEKVLAVPRCCQKRKGTKDRKRINEEVLYQENWLKERAADEKRHTSSSN